MKDDKNYSLLENNTFGIDVSAARFIEYTQKSELQQILPILKAQPVLHIGGGSNLLFTKDFDGIILHSAIKGIRVVQTSGTNVYVRVGAGEVWDDFVEYCVKNDYYGIENLSLIPGEVGASAVQNIGAYGAEVKNLIESVEVIDLTTGETMEVGNAACQYAYRQSRFKTEWRGKFAIISVLFKLSMHFDPDLEYGTIRQEMKRRNLVEVTASELREIIIAIRNEKLPDPKKVGNAGSFFMNPVISEDAYRTFAKLYPEAPHYVVSGGIKIPAGWLIEQCGWKGKTLGRAGVHAKQALVLINCGGATGQDVVLLSNTICTEVLHKFNIEIKPEVNWI
ncbi:MAG: UDP-N-acetylmuramate dehydrogenase [Bacteroidaceae bacterium]